ncbi:MAG: hypothetical protein HC812_01990 [Leptolyngbya sp. RL_3_1]|nr:hypothetical protein [Leptolyngbya sp. RL_3_1]
MNSLTPVSCSPCHSTADLLSTVNSALKVLAINPKVYLQNHYLQVLVEAPDVSDETGLATGIRQILQALELTSVSTVRIYGRARDKFMPAWVQEFHLGSDPDATPAFSLLPWRDRASGPVICLP